MIQMEEAGRQVFTCPIKNPDDQFEVDRGKMLIYEAAGEMGFNANHTPFQIQQYKEGADAPIQYRLEATFTA